MKLQLLIGSVALVVAGCASDPQPAPQAAPAVVVAQPAPTPTVVTQPAPTPSVAAQPEPPPPPSQVSTLVNAYDKAKVQHIAFKQVALDDLAETVAVTDVRRSKTNDGYDRVQVFVKNFAGDRVRIRYRFNWVDNDGVEVRDPDHDAWEKKTIDAGDDATLTTIAPAKNCYDFKLRMKRMQQEK